MTVTPQQSAFDAVIARFGLHLKRQGQEQVGPCPKCGGRDRFAINIKKGVWNCRGCQRGGDAIELVRHVDGCSFREALGILEEDSGHRHIRQLVSRDVDRDQRSENDENLTTAERIWNAASPLGSEAIDYFAGRGIDIDAVPDHAGLRFHPRCLFDGDLTPCIIGRFTTAIGNVPRGIWRRPIDGRKPMSLGPMAGCVIRLWPDDAVEQGLVLGEGPETTLAAATRIMHRGTLLQPAWATGSAGNMRTFPILAGIEALTLLVDHDESDQHGRRAGQDASEKGRARWEGGGAEVTLLVPRTAGADFNDVALA